MTAFSSFARHLSLIVVASLAGCGSRVELGQVAGTVRIDGQPLPGVLVTFIPEKTGSGSAIRSMGLTDEAGHYELRAEIQKAGAIIGKHQVIVEDLAVHSAPRSADGTVLQMPPVRFPARYSHPLPTPLTKSVEQGQQTIDLDLTGGT